PHPGRYPFVLDPIVRTVKLNRALIDGGSGLNILFAKTLDEMKIPRSELKQSRAPFHGVIPGTSATPLGTIKLPVTFGSRENIRAKADQDSIRLTAATLQDEGEVPTKKAAKTGISAEQEVKKITLDPSDPAKTALIGTGLGDK